MSPSDAEGWRVSTSGKGGYSCTFISPKWPRSGAFKDALYVKVTPARGWFVLRSGGGSDSASWLEDTSFADAMALLPEGLRDEARRAHEETLGAAKAQALKWQGRWLRMRAERAAAEAKP